MLRLLLSETLPVLLRIESDLSRIQMALLFYWFAAIKEIVDNIETFCIQVWWNILLLLYMICCLIDFVVEFYHAGTEKKNILFAVLNVHQHLFHFNFLTLVQYNVKPYHCVECQTD